MKKLFLIPLLILDISAFSQSKQDKSNAAYYKAEEQYKSGAYQNCIDKLNEAVELLGSSSIKIQYLRAKSYKGLGNYQQVKLDLAEYFALHPAEDDWYKEMLLLSEETDTIIRQQEEVELIGKKQKEEAEAQNNKDEAAWVSAINGNTNEAFENYISQFPTGNHANEAKINLERNNWKYAQKENTSADYNMYIEKYPAGEHVNMAKEELAYLKASQGSYMGYYEDYFENYPNGKYINETKAFLEKEYYNRAESYFDKQEKESAKTYYLKYLVKFPYGNNADKIEERLREIKTEGKNKVNNDKINLLNAEADRLKRAARTERAKAAGCFMGMVATAGAGIYILTLDPGEDNETIKNIGGGVTLVLGLSVWGGYALVHSIGHKQYIKQSRDLRKQAKAVTFNFSPAINPIYNTYGLAVKMKF